MADPSFEGVVRLDRSLQQTGKDAVLLEQAEYLAGHDRAESLDLTVAQEHPLVVRARVAAKALWMHQARRDPAEQLDLLAAHHVGATLADVGNAGNDRLALAGPDQSAHKLVDPRRAGHVRRFHPTAVRPDHSRHQQRQVAKPRADFRDRRRKASGLDGQHTLAVLEFIRASTGGVDPIAAAVGRSPVDRDISVRPSHACP
jgi:hypothetical protein